MRHISEDDLILHYYREADPGRVKHLAECPGCQREFEQLSGMLSGIALPEPPPRGEDYGAQMWSRIHYALNERKPAMPRWALFSRWPAVATIAILIAIAFAAGRYTSRPSGNPSAEFLATPNNRQLPQKVLVVALGDYLDRSEMLLVEVTHADRPADLDLNAQRRYASELVAMNRLYRQTAQRIGDRDTDALLDQLERVLMQLEHVPQGATAADIQQWRQEIESGGLLFRVRVAQRNMRAEAQSGHRTGTRETPMTPQDQTPIL
jgi:hypothetical protein